MKCLTVFARRGILTLLSILLFSSCDHKDLEPWPEEIPTRALVRFNVDWSQFTEDNDITGMTLQAYNQTTGKMTRILTNTIAYADIALEPGIYTIMVFNQSVEEYASLGFNNMDDIGNAMICATKNDSRWYTRADNNEMVAQEPAWFARDVMTNVEITQEMMEQSPYLTRTRRNSRQASGNESTIVVGTLTPKNIINVLDISVEIENFRFLRSARGAITSMAGCKNLLTNKSGNSRVTMLLENWSLISRNVLPEEDTGQIFASTRCFGLPNDRAALAEDNILILQLLLANGSIMTYEIPVGDKMWETNDPEHPLHISIQIPLAEPLPEIDVSGGGMGVNLGQWKEIVADIPL